MSNVVNDTIAAVSTPPGEGGIGVVRMSGPDALLIADRIFEPAAGGKVSGRKSHTVHYGCVRTPAQGEVVDEALLTVMKAPRTYTAEDVAEISCHGGMMPLKKILELCLNAGARLASPGEFTKRAFLNGRIDLSQAESVLDIIKARTDMSRKMAVDQLRGGFSRMVRGLRDEILDIRSLIELSIDFAQEDVEFSQAPEIARRVADACAAVRSALKTADKGMVLREGASVVICGRPNVGKSSLMNALLKHDRVIVTSVAGTTRDVIEESINISGVMVRLSDTAGIIGTRSRVELEGIRRSREKLEGADIAIFMIDLSRPLTERDDEIYDAVRGKKVVIVGNKSDLKAKVNVDKARERFGGEEILRVSAAKKEGLETIEDSVGKKLFDGAADIFEGPVVTNIRHKVLMEEACCSLERAADTAAIGYNGELLASDLNDAAFKLGLIIGESVDDDILDRIFSRFCIGK
ncbi:MAG: tRNA uridine-5-carboxymethylaminomethyl(34) synthesis GTPase MnmE [Candidatus Omnitrophota bacterium]